MSLGSLVVDPMFLTIPILPVEGDKQLKCEGTLEPSRSCGVAVQMFPKLWFMVGSME